MPSFILPPVLNSASSLQIVDNDQAVLTSSTDRTLCLWSARGDLIGKCHSAPVSPLYEWSLEQRSVPGAVPRGDWGGGCCPVLGGRADLSVSVHALEVNAIPRRRLPGHHRVHNTKQTTWLSNCSKAFCDDNILWKSQINLGEISCAPTMWLWYYN